MAVNGMIATRATVHQWFHLPCQQVAESDGVSLDQLRIGGSKLSRHILVVLLHLAAHMLHREQGVDTCIERGVYIGRKMLRQVVDTIGYQVIGEAVEHISDSPARRVLPAVTCQQGVDELVAHLGNTLRTRSLLLCLEQEECLVLDAKIGKSKLHAAILITG